MAGRRRGEHAGILARGLRPLGRVLLERAQQRPHELVGHVGAGGPGIRRRVLQMRPQDPHALHLRERWMAAHALVHHAPERIDVGRGADRLAADLLGRHVVHRPERLPGQRQQASLGVLGQAEVGDVPAAALVEQDVGGLDVAVNHPGRPQRLEPRGHVRAHLHRGLGVERTVALELLVERHALDVPLRHVRQAVDLAGVEHRNHVGVLHRLRDASLAIEPPPERLIARVVVLDQLQRHPAAVGPGRGVDLPHPPFSQQVVHVVVANLAPDAGVAHAHRSLMIGLKTLRSAPS